MIGERVTSAARQLKHRRLAKAWTQRDRPKLAADATFATRRDAFARAYEDIVLELLARSR
jgi:hypothetical protein